MILGIDGNEANVEKKVGVSEYAFELLWQFSGSQIADCEFSIYLKEPPQKELPPETEGWKYRIVKPKKLWTQIGLPLDLYLHKPRPNIFFTPTHYAPRFCPVPSVISIMDLSYVHFPQTFKKSDLYQLTSWTAYSVKKAKRIITISEASKNDIIKHYQVTPDRVMVTYPGFKPTLSQKPPEIKMDQILKKYGINGNYLLFVGTLQPRKNIARLIEAFSKLNSPSINLVIVGKAGWLYEEIYAAPKKFGVEKRVKFLDYVSDEDLSILYKNALCFVLPSLYEGFGLPILEAMSNGCPVVTSNVSSLPEAAGTAAVFVDPESVQSIKEGIEKVTQDQRLRRKLIENGFKQVKKFSWEKTAKETLDVLMCAAKAN